MKIGVPMPVFAAMFTRTLKGKHFMSKWVILGVCNLALEGDCGKKGWKILKQHFIDGSPFFFFFVISSLKHLHNKIQRLSSLLRYDEIGNMEVIAQKKC